MTRRPLTDAQVAAGLRSHLRGAGHDLHERINAEITTTPQERRLPSALGRLTDADPIARRRTLLLVAAIALAVAVSGTAIAGALWRESRDPDLTVTPEVQATATPEVREVIRGWPGTGPNAAGLYSWDGIQCSQDFCVMGFMHNGYGSGDITILIGSPGSLEIDEGATPVTVAGYDGIHRRTDPGKEEWIADIAGTIISIRMEARAGASAEDVAEGHAIVASMRAIPDDDGRGLALVFRLTSNDWDSG